MSHRPLNGRVGEALVVTVFGPGQGESIVVTAEDDWIVVDSCVDRKQARPAQLLQSESAEWSCAILTHDHYDHRRGFLDVLACEGAGPVGCSYPYVLDPSHWKASPSYAERLANGELEDVIAAVHDRWERNEAERWDMRRGDTQEIGEIQLTVFHPDDAIIQKADDVGVESFDPNRLSSPILVEWHDARVLLGADLPRDEWNELRGHSLDVHHFLKFPHHGSHANGGALSDVFGGETPDKARTWVIAPYNSHDLPGYGPEGGLAWCLDRVDEVHLTGLPIPARRQARAPTMTTHAELAEGTMPTRNATEVFGVEAYPDSVQTDDAAGEYRCFVSVAFGSEGEIQEMVHGDGSVVVRP